MHTLALHIIYRKYSFSSQDQRNIPNADRIQQMIRTLKVSEHSSDSCLTLGENIQKEWEMAFDCGLPWRYQDRFVNMSAQSTTSDNFVYPQWVLDQKASADVNIESIAESDIQSCIQYLYEPNRILKRSIRKVTQEEYLAHQNILAQLSQNLEIFGENIERDSFYNFEHSNEVIMPNELQRMDDQVRANLINSNEMQENEDFFTGNQSENTAQGNQSENTAEGNQNENTGQGNQIENTGVGNQSENAGDLRALPNSRNGRKRRAPANYPEAFELRNRR
jgi:hypothetical protein